MTSDAEFLCKENLKYTYDYLLTYFTKQLNVIN